MIITKTPLDGLLLVEPRVFGDDRGSFFEIWQEKRYCEAGISNGFVQDNISFSRQGTLRGLHFQNPHPQGKLVSVMEGEVFDVVVDLRLDSATYGKWTGTHLSAQNHLQLWIPEGFAHGFLVTSDTAVFSYKCTAYYNPVTEKSLRWDDPDIGINWPSGQKFLSPKDRDGLSFREIETTGLCFGNRKG